MSATDIFRCRDTMPPAGEGVVRTRLSPAETRDAPLPGNVKYPNDVQNTHPNMPSPTGRRP
jgi:hypothetical protein